MRVAALVLIMLFVGQALAAAPTFAAGSGLDVLLVDGRALHASLATRRLEDKSALELPRVGLKRNPQLSDDVEFVDAIVRSASQGMLSYRPVRHALYGLYFDGTREVGLYGLDASTPADADRLEETLRGIWAHNASMNRARVHRRGTVLVVVWSDGVAPETWEAINARLTERLAAP